ncbi:GntR family transcriptional regulator [Paracoccus chinensis]|uniref:GntR family transcriptional regulator, histidine utilization repressor n=1 Tax=Paracoccus chinensis TaxID=525640 RepID=A0A1G9HX70_9RHOB|nr:GntR family transcriptional regulator [Paracoccus chinensis]SDL17452.1 GntR family transcriptional regulator, histidine utilization repressor [Paracoccus chinensis]
MDRITHGVYPPGSLIPTEQEFAAEFGSARATVNRALTSLAERGVVERRRRVGTRVVLGLEPRTQRVSLPVFRDLVEERGGRFSFHFLGRVDRPVTSDVLERLFQSDPQDIQEHCTLICSDDAVICAERRWIDSLALPALTEEVMAATTANEWLACHASISLCEQVVSAWRAGEIEADRMLRCSADTPVLVYDSTLWIKTQPVSRTLHCFAPGFEMINSVG